ncbi:MAG TPA: alpha/beta fold hydrolase [Thermoanaerobaculia bacterium]|nr:alpha/beta fold hydrolase [Thermoanaerobaculia bacterium]
MRRAFEIESEEGLPIRGVVEVPDAPRCLFVIVHGFKGFKDWGFFPWISRRVAEVGAAAIRFDMSRSGIGERAREIDRLDLFAGDTYSKEIADLGAVIDWASADGEVGKLPLFLFGHSRGGGVAILTADRLRGRLRGIVTWSAISKADRWSDEEKRRWRAAGKLEVTNARTGQILPISTEGLDDLERNAERLDILGAARRMKIPALIVHGGADETVPPIEARRLAGATGNASLVVIEKGSHTFGAVHPFAGPTPELSFAMHATLAFLSAYCRTTRITTRE